MIVFEPLSERGNQLQFRWKMRRPHLEEKMKTEIVKACVPEALKREFEAVAAARGWNIDHAIYRLMAWHVACEKETAKRRKETLEAMEDIKMERMVDGDRVLDWLSGWGTEGEVPPPL